MADEPSSFDPKPEKESKKRFQVFISHAREDAELAERLCDALAERNVTCWLDKKKLKPGKWKSQIRDAIDRSQMCLVMLSRASEASKPWISQEWSFIQSSAWKRDDLMLVPLLLDRVDPPTFLSDWQTLRCDKQATDLNQLTTEIITLLWGRTHAEEKPEKKSQAKTVERFRKISRILAKASGSEHIRKEEDADE